jgi:hypothetical protein
VPYCVSWCFERQIGGIGHGFEMILLEVMVDIRSANGEKRSNDLIPLGWNPGNPGQAASEQQP